MPTAASVIDGAPLAWLGYRVHYPSNPGVSTGKSSLPSVRRLFHQNTSFALKETNGFVVSFLGGLGFDRLP